MKTLSGEDTIWRGAQPDRNSHREGVDMTQNHTEEELNRWNRAVAGLLSEGRDAYSDEQSDLLDEAARILSLNPAIYLGPPQGPNSDTASGTAIAAAISANLRNSRRTAQHDTGRMESATNGRYRPDS